MLFQAALIMWAFVLYRLNRTHIAAFLLALAVLTRMDSVIAVGVIGLHDAVTKRRQPWCEGIDHWIDAAAVCAALMALLRRAAAGDTRRQAGAARQRIVAWQLGGKAQVKACVVKHS